MENRREEIMGLKRLLVGVVVCALLITMLPFKNMGGIFANAEEILVPTEGVMVVDAKTSTGTEATESAENTPNRPLSPPLMPSITSPLCALTDPIPTNAINVANKANLLISLFQILHKNTQNSSQSLINRQ